MADNFAEICQAAVKAANDAGDKWMTDARVRYRIMDGDREVGRMLDVCGITGLRITDGRTKFYKWVEKQGGKSNVLRHKYSPRQEWGLGEACIGAMLKSLQDAGIKGVSMYSRID